MSTTLLSPVSIGGFPFNSSGGDRVYDASDWTSYFTPMVKSGVYPSPAGQLRVSVSEGMTLSVAAGAVYIQGVCARIQDAQTVTLAYGDPSYPRIDRVVARLDALDRTVYLGVRQGTAQSVPAAPALERTADGYEICLCQVAVAAGAVTLTATNLTDLRSDAAVCGWVSSAITDLPASVTQGLIYRASANGGSGAAYTATVDELGDSLDSGIHLTVVPAADSLANATLAVNGGTAYPICSTDGIPVRAMDLRADVPVDLTFFGGKYFFSAAGGLSRYATGTFSADSVRGVASITGLTFKPKMVILRPTRNGGTGLVQRVLIGLYLSLDWVTVLQNFYVDTHSNQLMEDQQVGTCITPTADGCTILLNSSDSIKQNDVWIAMG